MKCYNLSRHEAKNLKPEANATPDEYAWISIMEPCDQNQQEKPHINNDFLDKGNTLKIKFWDTEIPTIDVATLETIDPMTEEQAKEIVDFIMANKNKHIIINCAAGISRSGAIAKFCAHILGYEWEYSVSRAKPNYHVYNSLIEYYKTLNRHQK